MPARVVVVHDEPFLQEVAAALRVAGHHVAAFSDPMKALEALEASRHIETLVTRVRFARGTPNGVTLARLARIKRPGIIKVLFTALPEFQEHTEGLGKFMALPVSAADVVEAVRRLLAEN